MLDAERKVRDLIPVCLRVIAKLATFLQRINVFSYPPQAIESKRKNMTERNRVKPHKRTPDSSSLIDPSYVMVVGIVDNQGILQSPGSSSGAEKKKKDKESTSEKPKSSKSSDKPSKSVESRPSRSSADDRIDKLDKK